MKRLREFCRVSALVFLLWSFAILNGPRVFAFGKKAPHDPVVQIPPSHRNYLKILTLNFNSEDVEADSHGRLREQRFAALIDWVVKNDADILLIQEGWSFRHHPSVAIDLARVLDYDLHYRLVMGAPGLFYDSNAILAKKQYRMSDRQEYKLAHSAWDMGDGKNWTIAFGVVSYALGARLQLEGGEPFFVYTTHLIGPTEEKRSDQIRDLMTRMQDHLTRQGIDPALPKIIVGGDFNLPPSAAGSVLLRENGYTDTFEQAHPGDPSCTDCADPEAPYFNPITIGAGLFPDQSDETRSWRNDYLYVHGFSTLASTLQFSVPFESVWMSDHYGTLATVGTGGSVPDVIPNPTHDSDGSTSPTVLKADRDLFACVGERCDPVLPELDVHNSRGLVVQNRLKGMINMRLLGPGNIYTSSEAQLGAGRSAAFAFDTDGKFTIDLEAPNGGYRFGVIHVHRE